MKEQFYGIHVCEELYRQGKTPDTSLYWVHRKRLIDNCYMYADEPFLSKFRVLNTPIQNCVPVYRRKDGT